MKNLLNRLKQTPQMSLVGVAGALALIVIFFAILSFIRSKPPTKTSPVPVSYTPVSQMKNSYPKATPQPYKVAEDTYSQVQQSDAGALVITTEPKDSTVMIDPPPDAYAEAPLTAARNKRVPLQNPPFIADGLSIGPHTIVVSKPRYRAKNVDVIIKSNMVTSVYVKLDRIY